MRIAAHKSKLRKNKHWIIQMQHDYNLYGYKEFLFQAILQCEWIDIYLYEQLLLDKYRNNGFVVYNRSPFVDSTFGMTYKRPLISEETRVKLSIAMGGRILTPKTTNKISIALKTYFERNPTAQSTAAKKGWITRRKGQGCQVTTSKRETSALSASTSLPGEEAR